MEREHRLGSVRVKTETGKFTLHRKKNSQQSECLFGLQNK